MFLETVRPWLAGMSDCVLHSLTLRVMGIGESHLQEKIGSLLENENPTAALYAKTSEVVVRITSSGAGPADGRRDVPQLCRVVLRCAGRSHLYADRRFTGRDRGAYPDGEGKTVATAESCTGGLLSARLTSVPGSSEVFQYGACTYANEVKERVWV